MRNDAVVALDVQLDTCALPSRRAALTIARVRPDAAADTAADSDARTGSAAAGASAVRDRAAGVVDARRAAAAANEATSGPVHGARVHVHSAVAQFVRAMGALFGRRLLVVHSGSDGAHRSGSVVAACGHHFDRHEASYAEAQNIRVRQAGAARGPRSQQPRASASSHPVRPEAHHLPSAAHSLPQPITSATRTRPELTQ